MTDYLIVGQGIAGTNLAFTLLERGYSIKLLNHSIPFSSSKSAAGLFNPITGRKLTKTWLADQLFPYLHTFYKAQETKLNISFFHQKSIYVPFDSVEKQNNWAGASSDETYAPYVGSFSNSLYSDLLNNHHGGMELKQSGYVETRTYLASAQKYFQTLGIYTEGWLDPQSLQLNQDSVTYQQETFGKVIFTDGPQNAENPYFSGLDYRRVKGEILLIELLENHDVKHIINRGCWVIPTGPNQFRVGSTYDWRDLTTEPTEKGREKVEEKLQDLIKAPYKILDHWAGVRPATYDRRPFIGLHPKYPQIGLFNGMGSKGMSLSPYFAKHFADFLSGDSPLMPEVNLARKFNP